MEDLVRNTSLVGAASDGDDFFAAGAFAADLDALESKAKEEQSNGGAQKQYASIRDASTARLQALQEKLNVGRAKAKEAREIETKVLMPQLEKKSETRKPEKSTFTTHWLPKVKILIDFGDSNRLRRPLKNETRARNASVRTTLLIVRAGTLFCLI
jgi:hypothetical protein